MKHLIVPLIAAVLVLGNCSTENPTFPWVQGGFDEALAKAKTDDSKLVMIEFSTDWCSWCKRLDAQTWPDPKVIEVAQQHLIPIEVDAEKGDGIELAKKFRIGGYPTMVFLNAEGEEVDRIPGYLPAEDMVGELTRIVNGIDTYPTLKARLEENPNDPGLLIQFAQKVENMSGLEGAVSYWEKVPDLAEADDNQKALSRFKIAQHQVEQSASPDALKAYISQNADSPYIPEAYNNLSRYYRRAGDGEGEARVLQEYVTFMEQRGTVSTQLYNGYAWRMAELEKNLEDALVKSAKAIELLPETTDSASRAQVMDTRAEVLWKLGRRDEAVQIIDQCITLQPEDEYYAKQKMKFQTTQAGEVAAGSGA
ncbi:MAG: thioredoxin fold domain-containing protein [Lentisphaeria bacterium]|nr:thioredoxin fold domain-containing protein [Candidatus Neomarinimicrobiota bacterium]MCF7841685.1 thioredoxin fold domain-containing protein [Lentisphaeria bacterium]